MPFQYSSQVRLRDTDCAGLVFFPRLLEMAQDAYEAFCDQAGLSIAARLKGDGPILPIVHCEADFLQPLRLGDRFAVEVLLARLGETSFALAYRFVSDDGAEVARVRTVHVAMSRVTSRSELMPADIRAKLSSLERE